MCTPAPTGRRWPPSRWTARCTRWPRATPSPVATRSSRSRSRTSPASSPRPRTGATSRRAPGNPSSSSRNRSSPPAAAPMGSDGAGTRGRRDMRRRGAMRSLLPRPAGEDGMTLIEVVVAITLLALLMLGLGASLGAGLRLIRTDRQRVVAANLVTQQMERLRSLPFASIPLGRTELTETVDGIAYFVRQDVEWQDQGSNNGPCDGGTTLDFVRADVSVRWGEMAGVAPVRSQTLLAPTAGSF